QRDDERRVQVDHVAVEPRAVQDATCRVEKESHVGGAGPRQPRREAERRHRSAAHPRCPRTHPAAVHQASSEDPNGSPKRPIVSCSTRVSPSRARFSHGGGTVAGAPGMAPNHSRTRSPSLTGNSQWKKYREESMLSPACATTRPRLRRRYRTKWRFRSSWLVHSDWKAGTVINTRP